MQAEVRARLAAIRERESKATPGPWWGADELNQYGYAAVTQHGGDRGDIGEVYSVPNATFIAHSRADVPYLLGVAEAAERFLSLWFAGDGQDVDTCEAAIALQRAFGGE